jgi:hypothetical protein
MVYKYHHDCVCRNPRPEKKPEPAGVVLMTQLDPKKKGKDIVKK